MKSLGRTACILFAVSAVIYGLQFIIFKDPGTTAFYFLQDMAFMPITIAIATLAVGELMNERERKEKIHRTRMLTSSFFTELGAPLMEIMLSSALNREELEDMVGGHIESVIDVQKLQSVIKDVPIRYELQEETYTQTAELISENRTGMLILASNPVVLEHELFTDMLWGILHIMDEQRLRGSYDQLTEDDIYHLGSDFEKVLRMLLINWVSNAEYLRETYPNFYAAARYKTIDKVRKRRQEN